MDELVHLLLGGGDDARMIVPRVDDGDAGEAVEILLAVSVRDGAARRRGDDDGLEALGDDGEEVMGGFLNCVHFRVCSWFVIDAILDLVEDNPNSIICNHVSQPGPGVIHARYRLLYDS